MSLRARLLTAMGLVAVLLVVVAVVVVRTTTAQLLDQVDAQLVRIADPAATDPERRREPFPVTPPPEVDLGGPTGDGPTTVYLGQFVDDRLVTRAAPLSSSGEAPAPRVERAMAEELAVAGAPVTVGSTSAGVRYRIVVRAEGRTGALVVLGLPLEDVDAAVQRLVVVELVTIGGILVVLALTTWWVLRLGVQPIRRMTEAATTIAAGDLSARIPDATAGTEAAELGGALNVMLERIEAAFHERAASEARLRRFVADASHELRTPVTTIRGYAELFRMGGLEERGSLVAAMERTEAESVRMGRLVDDMLTLARLDRGASASTGGTPRDELRLDAVVADAVADLAVVHPDHPVTASLAPLAVRGSADQLHQVVANLLANAAVHTPAGTAVRVSVSNVEGRARLVVADDGPGMDDETAAHAFERFYRADPSRSRASGGSGLGLSIVAAIVAAHGGTVRLARPGHDADAAGSGTTVVVELPGSATV